MLGVIGRMSPGVLPSGVEAALIVEVETLAEGLDDSLTTIEGLVRDAGGSARRAATAEEQTAHLGCAPYLGRRLRPALPRQLHP